MSTGFAILIGAIAGFIAHVISPGDLKLMSLILAAVGIFLGWILASFLVH